MAQAGNVQAISGVVTAQSFDGQIRVLHIGDLVFENEHIITSDGASITITQMDGNLLQIAENTEVVLDESVNGAVDPYDATIHEVEQLQHALEVGENLIDETDEIALGEEEGHDFDTEFYGGDTSKGSVGTYLLDTENRQEEQTFDSSVDNGVDVGTVSITG